MYSGVPRLTEVLVDGVRSPVLVGGPSEAESAVVFVHGNPGPGRDWEALMPRVSAFARCVAPDMPGYGNADKPAVFDYTVEGYARHLGGLLDRLAVRRAHLVLHDFGGPWGLALAGGGARGPGRPAPGQHRGAAGLPLARLRPPLAHARAGGGPAGRHHQAGGRAGAADRQPARPARALRRPDGAELPRRWHP